ncbi:hypothetical protein QVD17_19016 [Tagetes erecta]|uniref:ABC transporter domain-containing protein n=1 Tax=Tagetes erecta TaxID=13708 RepID=A0AAD8NW64_TARER|nr:hypothetical protein QVD17_19016 [Tagetes erecta]
MFAAEFRLPRTLSESKKKQRVQALIDQLGLRNAADMVIGDEGHRGVSGGERRCVSIGTYIIHDPIILFLDEPTSGLDSTSAYMVVKVLRKREVTKVESNKGKKVRQQYPFERLMLWM